LLAVGLCLALSQPVMAQSQNDQGKSVYEADFFKTYSPANALQMIQRLPGFQLDSGNTEVRGFAQAAGNVVINGQRPSSKSDNLDTVLSRIPASRVLRIELASGNAFGADYAGKAQVANVILTSAGGLAGNLEGRLEREFIGRVLPKLAASAVLRTGASTFSASASYQLYSMVTEDGFDQLFSLPARSETEYRNVFSRNTEPFTNVALGWAYEEAPDRSFHINGKANWDKWTYQQTSNVSNGGTPTRDSVYNEDHLWRTWELSGDVTRPLAGGAIKLNALATHRHRGNTDDLSNIVRVGSPMDGFFQQFDDWRTERVGRVAWSHPNVAGWAVELGTEGAFNRLKSDLDVFSVAPSGARTPVSLPIADAIVSEVRGEVFANAGRKIAGNLRLDIGVNFEGSRLKVTGDATARRTLKFLKPKASLDWTPGSWHAQLSLKRTVNQLNFSDFVSAADFEANQSNGGNAELVPQRSWELLLTADRAVLGDGRIKVELGHNWVALVQDRVPVSGGLDAPGNLGNGESWIARSNINLPLTRLGLKGMRASLYGSYVKTSVRDPLTLQDRAFSGNSMFFYTGELRQDLGKFAWSVSMSGNTGSTFFRLGETDTNQNPSPNVSAFVEYRPNARTTVTLGADNLLDSPAKRWRYFYAPNRSAPTPLQEEYRERNGHRSIYVTVKRSFG
jgi:hypothetical protein